MTTTEIETASVVVGGGPVLPAMKQVGFSDPVSDDPEIWHLKMGLFLVSVIRYHPESAVYELQQSPDTPWEYQVDVLNEKGEQVCEDVWFYRDALVSKEQALQFALLALQEAILPIIKLKSL